MSHVDEGTLLAIRDRSLVDGDAREHVEECDECTAALTAAHARSESVARALGALDEGPVIDVDAAKQAVRRRLDERREAPPRTVPSLYRSIGRAAALILLASGAVYALPNSPLRNWIHEEEAIPSPSVDAGAPIASDEGIALAVPAGGLSIVLDGAEPGQRIEVSWTDGDQAAVVAGAGSRYAVSAGRIQVGVTSGDVRIDLPTGTEPVTVEANGQLLLRASAAEVEIRGTVVSRDPTGVVFTVEAG